MKTYYKVVKLLREKLPAPLPVVIRRMQMRGSDERREGYCFKKDNKFHIRINIEFEESKAIDVLLHEWAHTLSWNKKFDEVSFEEFEKIVHGNDWGIAYSKVYRLFEKHFT